MYRDDHIAYFRALIEGEDVLGWNPWWTQHAAEFERILPRAEYLRLKFGKVRYAAEVLQRHGVEVSWTPLGRKQSAWADLHSSVLDDRGRPRPELRSKAYGGAFGVYERGDIEEGTRRFAKYLRSLRKLADVEQASALEEATFDAEHFVEEGNREAGIAMLRLVAALPEGNDLLDPAILTARDKLEELAAG
jgi:hypothetical protein